MGLLSGDDSPSILRGPMVAKYLQMFVGGVDWGHLDYLILDLPPGTGDTQLTLAQSLPLSGAVIVTTPQHVSLKIARRGLRMFQGSSKISRSARSDRSCGPGAQTKGHRRGPKMPSRRRVLGPRRSVSAVGARGRFQCSGRTEGATTSMCGISGWPATAPVASRRLADDHGSIQRPCGATWLHGRSRAWVTMPSGSTGTTATAPGSTRMSTSERSAKATSRGRPGMSEVVSPHTGVVMAPGAGGFQRSLVRVDERKKSK